MNVLLCVMTDWDLAIHNCNALVVETPDTPECIPMEVRSMQFRYSHTSYSLQKVKEKKMVDNKTLFRNRARSKPHKQLIDIEGTVSFFSFMYKEDGEHRDTEEPLYDNKFKSRSFTREPLCDPTDFQVS